MFFLPKSFYKSFLEKNTSKKFYLIGHNSIEITIFSGYTFHSTGTFNIGFSGSIRLWTAIVVAVAGLLVVARLKVVSWCPLNIFQ